MTHLRLRFLFVWISSCVVVALPGRDLLAQSEPAQLLFTPLLLDPASFEPARIIALQLDVYHLTDGRRAECYRLGGWLPVGTSHAFAWELAYAGIESDERIRYGGGAPRWQWTTRLRNADPVRLAVDLAGVLPIGDANLHPLAAKAPSVHARLRLSPVGGTRWRLWVGYWGQRISPPTDRDRPLSYFPSGSGVDAACIGWTGRVHWEVWWHQQLGGLLDTRWLEARADVYLAEDLALRMGAATNPGPRSSRQFDLGWTAGLTWRPGSVEEAP